MSPNNQTKTQFALLAVIAVSVLCVIKLSTAWAEDPSGSGGAIVIHDAGECEMPGADSDGTLILGGLGESVLILQNNDKIMLKCLGVDIINDSGKTQVFEGFDCIIESPDGSGNVATTDTHAVVTKNGRASMTCTYYLD